MTSKSSSSLHCCCGFPDCELCKLNAQHLNSQQNNNQSKATTKNKYVRFLVIFGIFGTVLILLSNITYIIDPQALSIKHFITIAEGSFMFKLWQKPPVQIYFQIYIFNVTNSEKFLAGEEKLRFQEVGPYIYREMLEHDNVQFNDNGTMTYTPRRTSVPTKQLLDETFNGRGLNDIIITPNIPLLACASKTSTDFPQIVERAYSTLVDTLDLQPFINTSVREYLWGYDDTLVEMGNTLLPNWIHFKQLGFLDRLYDDGDLVFTMDQNKCFMTRINGSPLIFEGHDTNILTPKDLAPPNCQETVEGVYDAVLFSPNLPKTSITLYRKALVRPLYLKYEGEEPADLVNGVSGGLRFVMAKNLFNASETPFHRCYCGKKTPDGPCTLPDGISDISRTYYGLPLTLSFPHFYNADPSILEQIDGMEPVSEKHSSYVVIQQTFTEIPSEFQWILDFCVEIVPLLQYGFIYIAASLGFSLLLAATLGYLCHRGYPLQISSLNEQNSYEVVLEIVDQDEILAL